MKRKIKIWFQIYYKHKIKNKFKVDLKNLTKDMVDI